MTAITDGDRNHLHYFYIMREEVKRGWWDAPLVDEFEAVLSGLHR